MCFSLRPSSPCCPFSALTTRLRSKTARKTVLSRESFCPHFEDKRESRTETANRQLAFCTSLLAFVRRASPHDAGPVWYARQPLGHPISAPRNAQNTLLSTLLSTILWSTNQLCAITCTTYNLRQLTSTLLLVNVQDDRIMNGRPTPNVHPGQAQSRLWLHRRLEGKKRRGNERSRNKVRRS